MDQILPAVQTWLLEVGAKELLPSLIRGAIAFILAYLAAHAGILAKIGVSVAGNTLIVNLDTLQIFLVALLMGTLTALLRAAQHHTVAAVTGAPQSGAVVSVPCSGTKDASKPATP